MTSLSKVRPILVTGVHRSGTMWAGRMLGLPRGIGYIHEPFDPPAGTCCNIFDTRYTYLSSDC